MPMELSKTDLARVLQSEDIDQITPSDMAELFRQEKGLADFAPDGERRVDPRDGSMVIYNTKRAKRPHDNRMNANETLRENKPCPICEGKTTGVLDYRALSEGFTFINKNLFPCVFPFESTDLPPALSPPDGLRPGPEAKGLHFLQWTSSKHERDWDNMSTADLLIVLDRLAALERRLLETSGDMMPDTSAWHEERHTKGFVSIIKNVGAPVGGSLTHGHQQIVYSNAMPTQTYNNWRFEQKWGVRFSKHMQEQTPENLLVKDLDAAVVIVPYFMRRPYYSMLLIKDVRKQYLFDLNASERRAVVEGWSRLTAAYTDMLPKMGREVAYNVLVHTGPGAGLYIEFLPFTQETGGYEQLGLWVCQGEPITAAEVLRGYF